MTEHAGEVINLLLFMVLATGGTLIGLLVWVGQRLQSKVDELPGVIERKLDDLHRQVMADTRSLGDTLAKIERDLRGELTYLDRRVTRIEKFQILAHPTIASLDTDPPPGTTRP